MGACGVVECSDGGYLFVACWVVGVQPFLQFLFLDEVGVVECANEEVGFFVFHYVAADGFAESGFIAIGVENVVLKLESESDVDAEVVESVDVVAGSASDESSDFDGSGEEDSCFESDHFEVFVDGDVVT